MKLEKLLVLTVLAVMLTASFGFSESANCQTLVSPTSPPATFTTRIGVASNFWGPNTSASAPVATSPALSMVQAYLADKTALSIRVCHDSTTALEADLSSYSMIFGADRSMIDGVGGVYYSVTTPAPFVYAKGVPVLIGNSTITDISGLITAPSGVTWSGTSGTINLNNANGISGYSINANLTNGTGEVSVASSAAPYGRAGQAILHDMDGINFNPASSIPSWIYQLNANHDLWPNIAQTLDSVNNANVVIGGTTYSTTSVLAGFVAKSQICTSTRPVYVQFTNPTYTLDQAVGITTTASGAGLTAATGLYNYIKTQMLGPAWGTFLNGFCYIQPGS